MSFVPYYHKNYDGGLNDTASPTEIGRNEASTLYNWDITYPGKLKQRPGVSLVGSQISGNEITGLGAFIRTAGKDLLTIEDTNLYYLNSTTWTKIADNLTAGNLFWMENIQVLGKILIANKDNTIHTWDRSSTTLNSCLTDLGSSVPTGNVLRWHKNHLFILNNATLSSTTYPNRLFILDMGALTYTANSYVDVPGDGALITAVDLGDNLVLFKERAIQYLSGWGINSWKITTTSSNVANVSEKVGIAGPRAATSVGDEVWFVDDEGKIRRLTRTDFDAFRHDIISTKIETTLSGINRTQLSQVVAWTHNNKVYFGFPDGTDLYNSILCVFDILAAKREAEAGRKAESWTTYIGWTPNLFADYTSTSSPDLYFGNATDGSIYKVDESATNDDGVVIDCRWDGKNDYFDKPDRYKNYGFGSATAQSESGTANIDIYASIDQSSFAQLATLTATTSGSRLGPTGSFLLGPTGNATVGGSRQTEQKYYYDAGGLVPSGKSLMMSIRHAALTERAEVNTWSAWYKFRQAR